MLIRRIPFACVVYSLVILLPVGWMCAEAGALSLSDEKAPFRGRIKLSPEPHFGETIRVELNVTATQPMPRVKVVWGMKSMGVEIVGGESEVYCAMEEGETKLFSVDLRFISSPVEFTARVTEWGYDRKGNEKIGRGASVGFYRVIVDEETGRYGGEAEYRATRPEYQYDPMVGRMTTDIGPPQARYNRMRVDRLKKREATLTDWEAMYLLHDIEVLFQKIGASEDEATEVLLEAIRIARDRGLTKDEALERILERPEFRKRRYLFRPPPDSRDDLDVSVPTEAPILTTKFTGCWLYKKHKYNKETGLDSATIDHALPRAKIFIWVTWPGTTYHRVAPTVTDEYGNFSCFTETPPGVELHVFPAVYMDGPESSRIRVVSDSFRMTHPIIETDSTIWGFWDLPPSVINSGDSLDFGTLYAAAWYGLWPDRRQPRSGAANIFATLVEAYEYLVNNGYVTVDTIGKVRAKWEPDYVQDTRYLADTLWGTPDTIWISGDTVVDTLDSSRGNSDEWDDINILHEYGHHVHNQCSEWSPNYNEKHQWYKSDSLNPGTSWPEGWAHFFSSIVTDSVFQVDTRDGINGGWARYRSIEDPWDHNYLDTDSLERGPWCEGAVAGVLWDINDAVDELPYSYPPGDSVLADTLTLGFDGIWNVFDDHDPPPPNCIPHGCWNVYYFRDGWLDPIFDYDHEEGMKQIYEHHGMDWSHREWYPPKGSYSIQTPDGVKIYIAPDTNNNIACFPALQPGFCVYRKQPSDTAFTKLADQTDTTYTDSTVTPGQIYIYTITAYDTLGNQSDTSNNMVVWVPGSDDSLATAYSNTQKIVWTKVDSTLCVAFSSGGSVCCQRSTNLGDVWSVDTVGQGGFPTIALDPDGDLWMVWTGNCGSDAHMTAYRGILCSRYSSGSWSEPETLETYLFSTEAAATQSESLQCVSFSTDSMDTGHVAVTYKRLVIQPDSISTWYHYLDYIKFATDSPATSLPPVRVDEGNIGNTLGRATVAADSHGVPHIAWEWQGLPTQHIRYASGPFFLPIETLSGTLDSYSPYIEYNKNHDRISAIWESDTNGVYEIYSRFKELLSWQNIRRVSSTGTDSRLPTISGNFALWSEWESGVPRRILRSRYGTVSGNWGAADTVSRSDSSSLYAHTLNVPDDTLLFSCWTEASLTSHWIASDLDTGQEVGGVPSYYVDAGRPLPSPYLRHRGGFDDWGDLPELTVDTDPSSVSYSFGGLDPRASYELRTIHYFESPERAMVRSRMASRQIGSTHAPSRPLVGAGYTKRQARAVGRSVSSTESLAVESDANFAPVGVRKKTSDRPVLETMSRDIASRTRDPWMVGIRLDGHSTGTVELPPESVKTFRCEVPQELTNDGTLTLDISRLKGDFALVSEIYLYPVDNTREQPVNTGAQMSFGIKRNRFRFHKLAPNPSKGEAMASYELARPCDVEIGVFDVAGRLVIKVSRLGQSPGVHSITWGPAADVETQDVAAGAYFVKLTAKNAVSGVEEFLATRKLILIR